MSKRGENIYKRKDGRWEGWYKKPHSEKFISIYGHSYKDVKSRLISLKTALCSYDNRQSFSKVSEEWLAHTKLKTKQSSYENYLFLLHKHILSYFGNLRHIFASICVVNHFDIKALSEILGHSDTAMTLNRYAHSDMETKRRYMDALII